LTSQSPFRILQILTQKIGLFGRVRRVGLWSWLDEFVFLMLRNPRATAALKFGTFCAAIAIVGTAISIHPPSGRAENVADAGGKTAKTGISGRDQVAALAPRPVPQNIMKTVIARSGDTFMKLLTTANISRGEAHKAINAMRKVFDPRDLRPGHAITATFGLIEKTGNDRRLTGISFNPSMDKAIRISRNDTGVFKAHRLDRELKEQVVRLQGAIKTSLYAAASQAGLPPSLLMDVIRLFSWDVDFQRDIQSGDTFNVLAERSHLEDGRIAHWGDIQFAEMIVSGKTHRYYRFESHDRKGKARVGYFDESGHSARKPLLKTPVDGARLSSRYGKRRHPILGYTRMHRGVDFAAPRGTPIYAAGNGKIISAGRKGGYGKYVQIRHNERYATAYGHMHRIARGMRRGKRVKQGQIIGYVGSTGRSTGPHLHYEVLTGGRQVNPLRLRLPSGRKLRGKDLATFRSVRTFLDRRVASIPAETRLTQR
jgi:murein DD-endopeptidase MepM/ murein hydrolase activator NlpD